MYHFSKRIKCEDCNGRYRGVTERGKRKYFCSTYHNKGTCQRWLVSENLLLDLCLNHYQISLLKSGVVEGKSRKAIEKPTIDLETLLNRVKEILVSPKERMIRIDFKDGTSTRIEPNRQAYYLEE